MTSFFSRDFGAFVFGRKFLLSSPLSQASFFVSGALNQNFEGEGISEQNFWQKGAESLLSEKTRFGRIAFFYDRKNFEAQRFCESIDPKKFLYCPQEKKRACSVPEFHFFPISVLWEMANEGMADTVEFRRLGRKFLRSAKNAHCDTAFFLDAIFGEQKTFKILRFLAGTQMKVFTPADFFEVSGDLEEKGGIRIFTKDDPFFTHKRACEILKQKISFESVCAL